MTKLASIAAPAASNSRDSPANGTQAVPTMNPGTSPAAPYRIRHQSAKAKTSSTVARTASGGRPPRNPRNRSVVAKNASPKPSMTSAASPRKPQRHPKALSGGENAAGRRLSRLLRNGFVTPRKHSAGSAEMARRNATCGQYALDEEVMERLHSLAEEGAQGDSSRKSSGAPWKVVVLCAVLVGLSLASMAALLAPRWYGGARKLERSSVCNTAGCQYLASEILGRLDRNVDPCKDIEAHVCGSIRWKSELITDTATDMIRLWQMRGAAYLNVKRRLEGAFALYRACMDPGRDSLRQLVSFMRERGLRWPEYGSMGRHALNVLLDLLLNWGVPFWFEMSLRKLPNHTRDSQTRRGVTVVQIRLRLASFATPNISSDMWLSYLNEHMSPHRFQPDDYILADDLSLATSMNGLFGRYSNEDMLYALGWWFAQQFSVIASLDGGVASYGSAVLAQANRPIDCYTLAESRFRRQLFLERAHASLGTTGMQQVEEILEKIRNTTIGLLESTPWLDDGARKEGAAIVAATTFEAWKPDLGSAANDQVSFGGLVELPSAAHYERRFTEALQASEEHETRGIGNQAARGFPFAARTTLPVALRDRRGLASDQSGDENRQAQRLRPSYSTAVQGWIETAKAHKGRLPNWPRDESLQHRHLSYSQLAQYDYWWNSLFLQMAAFAEPLFVPDTSLSAANYGGLGFVVAKHLVKAFDFKRGTRLDSKRTIRSWISGPSLSAYERKIACTGDNRLLDHIAALEVALAAAFGPVEVERKNGSMSADDSRIRLPRSSEVYSPEMVFFLVYCRATCGLKAPGCGDVLRRVARFGRAFRCPANSPMTSAPTCSFFGK
ncbi:hypothetical protein V5799_034118 [Amblyomma americanum]|uniref:Uncharacterized protein n=1 Tax=Amblyomma americanum TaxID=6943 RepID=A0AAQ4DLD4_AMBAM